VCVCVCVCVHTDDTHTHTHTQAPKLHKIADTLNDFVEQNVQYSDTQVGVVVLGVFQVMCC